MLDESQMRELDQSVVVERKAFLPPLSSWATRGGGGGGGAHEPFHEKQEQRELKCQFLFGCHAY